MMKYVFVTGGVVSSLGKGTTAASLGRLLKARGYKVAMQKCDTYYNFNTEGSPRETRRAAAERKRPVPDYKVRSDTSFA